MKIPKLEPEHMEVDGLVPYIGKNGMCLVWRGKMQNGLTWVYYKTPEMGGYMSWLSEIEVFEDLYERL